MQVIFERYETAGNMTRTETMTIEDAKWTGDIARFARDWFGIAKKGQQYKPGGTMPWEEVDVNGEVLE